MEGLKRAVSIRAPAVDTEHYLSVLVLRFAKYASGKTMDKTSTMRTMCEVARMDYLVCLRHARILKSLELATGDSSQMSGRRERTRNQADPIPIIRG